MNQSLVLYLLIQSWYHSWAEALSCLYSDGGCVPTGIAAEWGPGSCMDGRVGGYVGGCDGGFVPTGVAAEWGPGSRIPTAEPL